MTCPRCADLQRRLDDAEARAERLERAQGGEDATLRLMAAYGLTQQQALLLRALAATPGVATKDQLWDAIAAWNPDIDRVTVNVIACRVRKNIAPLRIQTIWGVGYRLHPDDLAAVRAVIG